MSKKDLIQRIESSDPTVRGEAWQNAGDAGPEVIRDLARVMATGELEISRAAKRALWRIVRYVGRPGATEEKGAVVAKLVGLLADDQPVAVRREVLWMLSELAEGGQPIQRAAELLLNEELREDARMALERVPGPESLAALRKGLEKVPDDFKIHIAHSLRVRGVKVRGYPCRKLVPTKKTNVQPAS